MRRERRERKRGTETECEELIRVARWEGDGFERKWGPTQTIPFRFGLPGGAEIIPCPLVFQPEAGFVQDGGDDDRSAKRGCAHGTSREIWPKRKVMCCFLALDEFGVFQVRGGPSRQQLRVWCLSHQLWPESRSAPTLVSSCGGPREDVSAGGAGGAVRA